MYATNYLERAFLNTLKGIQFTAPAVVYVGLYITSPSETGAGVEVNYNGYERQLVRFNSPAEKDGVISISNEEQINFPQTESPAGTVTYIGISDSKLGGNMLAYGKLTEELEIRAQEAPVFMPDEIKIYSTGNLSTAYKKKLLGIFNGRSMNGVSPHLALFNNSPDKGGSELIGDNYARVPIEFSAPEENETGQSVIKNANKLNFNRPTTDWGTWDHTVVMDSLKLGEAIWIYDRGTAKELKKGYMPIANIGALKFAIN